MRGAPKQAPRLVAAGPGDRVWDYEARAWKTHLFSCNGCNLDVPHVVEIGSHSDEEYGPCHYCPDCVRRMMVLFYG